MAKMSLIEGIQEYARATDSLGIPSSELEKQKFEEYLAEHNIKKDSKLNLNSLRKIANEINAKQLKSSMAFYTRLARLYGIEYYDTGEDIKEITENYIEIPEDTTIEIGGDEVIYNKETNGVDYVEETTQGVDEGMQSDIETMQIPKISLSATTIRGLQGISEKTVDKLVEAIQLLKATPSIVEVEQPETYEIDESGKYTEYDRNEDVIGIPFSKVKNAVQRGMNVIYRGVPGCGKTHAAKCDAKAIIGFKESNRIKQIDFTENLDYSDTMVGLRQQENGRWQYIKGEIAEFCAFASKHPDNKFVLILNELTRANTEAVLGQMFTAMENKYRGDKFTLDNGDIFICPKNLIVLATMNGTDRGVKKLDKATEERFYIIDVDPLWEEWTTNEEAFDKLIDTLGIIVGTDEEDIVKRLCKEMAAINNSCDEGGILTADSKIGQRQLMQFIKQKDIDGNRIVYNKETLGIVIEQLISRVKPLLEINSAIESNLDKLNELMEKCHE